MSEFLTIFITSVKYLWRNPVSVLVYTVFPILIILILGNALAGFISPTLDFEPLPVAVVAEPDSRFAEFLQSDDAAQFLNPIFLNPEDALEKLTAGEVYVIITEKENNISITRTAGGGLAAGVITSVVESHVQISEAMGIAMMSGGDISQLLKVLSAEIGVIAAPLGNRVPDAMDYYAVTMLVMILIFTGFNSLELLKKSLLSTTGDRILSTPVSKPVLIGGLIAASTVTSYAQGLITFLFSMFVYGVYWGERIPLVLLTLFGMCLFSQGLGIFFIMLCKNANAAMGIIQVLAFVFTFTSKGYTVMSFGAAEEVFQYMPNALAQNVIFSSAYGGNEAKMMTDLVLLFGYGTVLFIIAFILGKRRLA